MSQVNAISRLARELLGSYCGARFSLEELEGIGEADVAGQALRVLQDQGAVRLRGEVIEDLNVPLLWQASGLGTVIALMQLPSSLRAQGMATGLLEAFAQAGVPLRLGFMRGATRRVETLLEGRCDIIVTSKMTARLDLEQGRPVTLIYAFGFRTYVEEYVVAFRDPNAREIVSGMRVALDPVSIDQTILTSYECQGKEVEFVDAPYVQSLAKLAADELDAVIWSRDELKERGLGFNLQPLSDTSPRRVTGEDTAAVLVTSREKAELGRILAQRIDLASVQRIQEQILRGKKKPSY